MNAPLISLRNSIFLTFFFTSTFSVVLGSDFPKITLINAIKKATAENKNVLVYITAKWCGPCARMEKKTFSDEMVKKAIATSYIPVEINAESWRGAPIAKEFSLGYPTFVILNPDRKVLKHDYAFMDVPKFMDFLSLESKVGADLSNASIRKDTKDVSELEKPVFAPGVKLGISTTTINNTTGKSSIGYEFGGFVSYTTGRLLIRPGISIIKKGTSDLRLTYLQMPVDLGLTIHKGAVLGLPGGYRIVATPYAALLLNNKGNNLKTNDYGLRYGASVYIGDKPKLEMLLTSEFGIRDINVAQPMSQTNRLFNLTFAYTL